jgi:hypothetical protein
MTAAEGREEMGCFAGWDHTLEGSVEDSAY